METPANRFPNIASIVQQSDMEMQFIDIYLRWSPISIWDQDSSTLVYNKLSCFPPSRCRFFLNIFQFIALQGWTQNRTCFLPSTLFFFRSLTPGSCSPPAGRLAVTHGLPWSVTGHGRRHEDKDPFISLCSSSLLLKITARLFHTEHCSTRTSLWPPLVSVWVKCGCNYTVLWLPRVCYFTWPSTDPFWLAEKKKYLYHGLW